MYCNAHCSQWRVTCAVSSSSEQTLRNLVNKSGQRISEMYRQLQNRLKSTTEKELFQKKMARNQDEREEAHKNIISHQHNVM